MRIWEYSIYIILFFFVLQVLGSILFWTVDTTMSGSSMEQLDIFATLATPWWLHIFNEPSAIIAIVGIILILVLAPIARWALNHKKNEENE